MKISNHKSQATSKSHAAAAKADGPAKKKGGGDLFDKAIEASGKDKSEGDLLKQQKKLQEHAEQVQLKSNLIAMEHEMMKSIISNFRF